MAKAAKPAEERIVAKNYKMVLLETLLQKSPASTSDLTSTIQKEIPFLKFESPYKVKAEYVLPTLQKSKCFVKSDGDAWTLSRDFLNLVNYAFGVLKKGGVPMTLDELKESIALENGLHPSDIPLSIGEDERFEVVEIGGQYFYFIQDWEFANDYAFAFFVDSENRAVNEEELQGEIVRRFKKKKKGLILMLNADPRFRKSTEGLWNVFPKFLRRFKRKEMSKSALDTICARLEGVVKSLRMVELAEEFLGVPFPLTNLEEVLNEDLRFTVSSGKVRRSRLTADQIRAAKRRERVLKKAEKEQEEAQKAREREIEAEAREAREALAAQAREEVIEEIHVEEIAQGSSEPEDEGADEFRLLLRKVGTQLSDDSEEILPGVRRRPAQAEEAPSLAEGAKEETLFPAQKSVLVRKREPVIRKAGAAQVEQFDVAATGVDMEELNTYLKDLTERDGLASEITPVRFDDLMIKNLPFRSTDYRPTSTEVTQFIVRLARPRLDQLVVDMACGRGDILLAVLKHVKGSLRKDHEQDRELFKTFCDEQIVGMDVASMALRGARLGLKLSGFEMSLLEQGNALDDTDILFDDMYTQAYADLTNLNAREARGFVETASRVLGDDGEAFFVVQDDWMVEEGDVPLSIQERFLLKHQVIFTDLDGVSKHVLHLQKVEDRREKTKVFRLDHLDQLSRVLDLIY